MCDNATFLAVPVPCSEGVSGPLNVCSSVVPKVFFLGPKARGSSHQGRPTGDYRLKACIRSRWQCGVLSTLAKIAYTSKTKYGFLNLLQNKLRSKVFYVWFPLQRLFQTAILQLHVAFILLRNVVERSPSSASRIPSFYHFKEVLPAVTFLHLPAQWTLTR